MLSIVNSSKYLKKETIPILYNYFQKIEEGTLLNSFYEATVTLISKSGKDVKENDRPIS